MSSTHTTASLPWHQRTVQTITFAGLSAMAITGPALVGAALITAWGI